MQWILAPAPHIFSGAPQMADPKDAKKVPRKCGGILRQLRRFFLGPPKWPIPNAVESCASAVGFSWVPPNGRSKRCQKGPKKMWRNLAQAPWIFPGSVQMADPRAAKKDPIKCSGILRQRLRFLLGPSDWPIQRMPERSPEDAEESCTSAVGFFWVRPNGRS